MAPRSRTGLVPVLIGVTMLLSIISSLGAPLIPAVAEAFGVSLDSAQWSLTATLLAGAVAAPVMGRLGDGPHRRETILAGLAIVTVGCVIAGLADSLAVLIAGRVLQGVGLGLAPLTMAAARDQLPAARAPGVIGVLSVAGAAGVGLGYPVSGLVARDFGVHAAFLFGALMSGAALAAAALVIPHSGNSSVVRLDLRGAVVVAVGLVLLLLPIGQGATWGWGSPVVLGLFAAAFLVLATWARSQLARPAPLVDLRQLRHRAVLTADIAALVLGTSMYMFLTLVSEFVQAPRSGGYGFSASALLAGTCLVPYSLASLAASRGVVPLIRRFGNVATLVGGTLVIAAAGTFFAVAHAELWEAFVTMGIVGAGFGLTFATIPGLIARSVPAHETGSALGLYQVIRYIGFALGSALAASILADHTAAGTALPSRTGYVVALSVGAGVCVASALMSLLLSGPRLVPAHRHQPHEEGQP